MQTHTARRTGSPRLCDDVFSPGMKERVAVPGCCFLNDAGREEKQAYPIGIFTCLKTSALSIRNRIWAAGFHDARL